MKLGRPDAVWRPQDRIPQENGRMRSFPSRRRTLAQGGSTPTFEGMARRSKKPMMQEEKARHLESLPTHRKDKGNWKMTTSASVPRNTGGRPRRNTGSHNGLGNHGNWLAVVCDTHRGGGSGQERKSHGKADKETREERRPKTVYRPSPRVPSVVASEEAGLGGGGGRRDSSIGGGSSGRRATGSTDKTPQARPRTGRGLLFLKRPV